MDYWEGGGKVLSSWKQSIWIPKAFKNILNCVKRSMLMLGGLGACPQILLHLFVIFKGVNEVITLILSDASDINIIKDYRGLVPQHSYLVMNYNGDVSASI